MSKKVFMKRLSSLFTPAVSKFGLPVVMQRSPSTYQPSTQHLSYEQLIVSHALSISVSTGAGEACGASSEGCRILSCLSFM